MTAAEAVEVVRERCGVEPTHESGLVTLRVLPGQWQPVARVVKEDLGCQFFNWLSAVDWKDQGFEVLCRIENLDEPLVVTMRTRLPAGETRCPTLTQLYRGADWMERECYDMFGIVFEGHPDLRRILLSDDWEGYPLRKDYAVDTPLAPYR